MKQLFGNFIGQITYIHFLGVGSGKIIVFLWGFHVSLIFVFFVFEESIFSGLTGVERELPYTGPVRDSKAFSDLFCEYACSIIIPSCVGILKIIRLLSVLQSQAGCCKPVLLS